MELDFFFEFSLPVTKFNVVSDQPFIRNVFKYFHHVYSKFFKVNLFYCYYCFSKIVHFYALPFPVSSIKAWHTLKVLRREWQWFRSRSNGDNDLSLFSHELRGVRNKKSSTKLLFASDNNILAFIKRTDKITGTSCEWSSAYIY